MKIFVDNKIKRKYPLNYFYLITILKLFLYVFKIKKIIDYEG